MIARFEGGQVDSLPVEGQRIVTHANGLIEVYKRVADDLERGCLVYQFVSASMPSDPLDAEYVLDDVLDAEEIK